MKFDLATRRAQLLLNSATAVFAVFAVVVGAAAPARAERQTFLGWHQSSEVSYLTVATTPGSPLVVRACRAQGDDVPAAWPPALSVDPGVLCADLSEQSVGARAIDFARNEVSTTKTLPVSPFGLKVELAVDGPQHTLSVRDGEAKKIVLPILQSTEPLKLAAVLWRKDGAAVAITLEATKKVARGEISDAVVVTADVSSLLVGGAAGRKVAIAKEKEAQLALKSRDWSTAGRILDEAIAADSTFAPAHYARAAADAQGGIGRTSMIEHLTWLKQESKTDPATQRLLEQARSDRAFDAWTGEPEVRELLGLPAVSTMDVPSRLLERLGSWTLQGATCRSPWLTLVFHKGTAKAGVYSGTGTLEIAESCKGKKHKTKQTLTWTQSAAGSAFDVATKAGEAAGIKIPVRATIVLDEAYQQLKLKPEGDIETLGNFEPGVAQLDDSTL